MPAHLSVEVFKPLLSQGYVYQAYQPGANRT